MSGYIGVQPVPQATQTRQSFTATANQTSFGTLGYQVDYLSVYLNGVKLNSADFTATNGSDIVLGSGCAVNDILEMVAFSAFTVANQTFTGTTTVNTLAVTGNVDGRDVSVDGTKLDGIEASATADQTNAEIKTAVQAGSDIALGGNPTTTTQSAGNNTTRIATTAFTQAAVTALVDSSPDAMNTLNELAAALGDDASFSTTVTNSIATKLPLAGGALTGNVTFGDGNKAIFGAGSDLQIYHDGANSFSAISDQGTGPLVLLSNNLLVQNAGGTENMITAIQDGAVTLFHNNAAKLATTATGVAITGTTTSSGQVKVTGSSASAVAFSVGDTGTGFYNTGSNSIGLSINGTNKLLVNNSGNVGIGTSSPSTRLTVLASSANGIDLAQDPDNGANSGRLFFTTSGGTNSIRSTSGALQFSTGATAGSSSGTERMRIDSSGNVLAGKTSSNGAVAGNEFLSYGRHLITVNNTTCSVINRLGSNDGTIQLLQKAGNAVGEFGVEFSDNLFIRGGSGHGGIGFGTNTLYPSAGNGSTRDNEVTLGATNNRFKDLHLSGGISFAGTSDGAGTDTSELLNDYEEGTFTPVLTVNNSLTGITQNISLGRYIKVGRHVTAWLHLRLTAKGSSTGHVRIQGFPYAASNLDSTDESAAGTCAFWNGLASAATPGGYMQKGTTKLLLINNASGTASPSLGHGVLSNTSTFYYQVCYNTIAVS